MTNIKQELEKINQSMAAAPAGTQLNHISLFPGITLCFITFQSTSWKSTTATPAVWAGEWDPVTMSISGPEISRST